MATQNNETTTNMEKPKKQFFGCKSKVATALFVVVVFLYFIQMQAVSAGAGALSLLAQIIAFVFMLVCIYKDMKTKEYGIGKKIAVWIWDIFIALIVIGIAISLANKVFQGYVSTNTQISCTTPIVKTNVTNIIKELLVENNFVTKKELNKVTVTFSDITELKSTKDKQTQAVECKAKVKIANVDITPSEYRVDYNSTLDIKTMRLQSYILLR